MCASVYSYAATLEDIQIKLFRVCVKSICIFFLGIGAASAAAADWPMFRRDAQHGGASDEELPANLELIWTTKLPPVEPAWPDQPRMQFDAVYQPIISDNTLVIASPREDCVTAYSLSDGSERWRFFAGGPFRLPPAAANGKVYAGSDDGYLYALDLGTGKLLWKVKGAPKDRLVLGNERLIDTWPVRGGPVVADGKVYFAAGLFPFMGVFVYCLDAETGAVVWTNSSDGAAYLTQPHGAKSFSGIAPEGALTIAGERLLIPNGRAVCASYERATGKMQYFSFASKYGGHDVVVYNDYFFNGGLAYNLETGKVAGTAVASPVIADGIAYGFRNSVGTASASTGTAATPAIHGIVALDLSSPIEAKTLIRTIFKGPLACFKTSATVPFQGGKTLLAAGHTLYVGGADAISVFTLPLGDGQVPSRQIAARGTVASLIAAHGKLVAVTDSGELLCYGADKPVERATIVDAPAAKVITVPDDVAALVKDSGVKAGYALVLGTNSLPAATALLAQTEMDVILLEPSAEKCDVLRRELQRAGAYGKRLAVTEGSLATTPLPSYFASLIIGTDSTSLDGGAPLWMNAYRVMHPYHGAAYLKLNDDAAGALHSAVAQFGDRAVVKQAGLFTQLLRTGGVPGGGNWTHEHADAGNTRISHDQVVKAPLGVLWWGGSSHDGILPRHGHGPQPQVLDGRLIIEGVDLMRAVDIYTGRVLWETPLARIGSSFNILTHQPGANGSGTNYISTPEGIYVALDRKCLLLDLDTGKVIREFALPDDALPGGVWGYINVLGDYLIGGAGIPRPQKPAERKPSREDEDSEDHVSEENAPKGVVLARPIASKQLFVFDRKSGKQLWSVVAQNEFRHNGICAGSDKTVEGGMIFAIDRPIPDSSITPIFPPVDLSEDVVLNAFSLPTGKLLWRCDHEVFGTWLSYSETYDVLVEAGRRTRDSLFDEPRGMRAFKGSTGEELWVDPKALGPAMIRGKTVLKEKSACDLFTGRPLMIDDPITGISTEWTWTRMYGCNTPAGSEHLLTFRSGAAGFYDLSRNGGTGNFGGFRSSCTHNLVVAGGILCAPDYTRTCMCSYQLQTSVALIPDADVEVWTYVGTSNEVKDPIKKLGLNFGAWGDRMDDDGTQWLEYPSTGGPSPKIKLSLDPAKPDTFSRHSMLVSGAKPWVTASGMLGVKSLDLPLNETKERDYTVRLYFAEPQELKVGERVMTVKVQGKKMLENFDIVAEAGTANRSVIKEFRGVRAKDALKLEFVSVTGATLLCGLEIIAE